MKRIFAALPLIVFFAAACSAPGLSSGSQTAANQNIEPPETVPPQEGQTESPADEGAASAAADEDGKTLQPVYVTVALHIEDVQVYAKCDAYPDFRQKLLQFAEAIAPYKAAVNLQIEYEFFLGVSRCETPALKSSTQNLNVLDFLAARYGYEIDPHQEGGWDIEGRDNYADIRYLGGQVATAISENVGGLVWDDPEQWSALTSGEAGLQYPDFSWTPQVLTLAVSSQHHRGDFKNDDTASGVWMPKGAGDDFWTHDPNGPLIYIGPGEYDNWSPGGRSRSTLEFVEHILGQMEIGALDQNAIYTATIAVPQSIIFHPEEHHKLLAIFEDLAPLAVVGEIEYVTYSRAAQIWQTRFHASPNIYLDQP